MTWRLNDDPYLKFLIADQLSLANELSHFYWLIIVICAVFLILLFALECKFFAYINNLFFRR